MKQLVQNYKTGELKVIDSPAPALRPGGLLVRNVRSAISVGTERLGMEFAGKSLLGKARARPDLARQVIDIARNEGLTRAYKLAVNRLDTLMPLGYSSAGVVLEVGEGVEGFRVGDRVACGRSGFASHAEIIFVPTNLCARLPDDVDFDSAAFCTVAAVALHSLRLCGTGLGECLAIVGVGLLGQMAAQIARAAGNRVFVMDTNAEKVSLARELGADGGALVDDDGCVESALAFSKGVGCDAVLILASTASNVPLEIAAQVSRERGAVVAPGLVELDIPRDLFYEKELSLTVPRAWGPGFDDESCDPVSGDYPHGYVRWTGQRNMAEALDLMAGGRLRVAPLITDRFGIDEAEAAYRRILDDRTGNHIGSLISYDDSEGDAAPVRSVQLRPASAGKPKDRVNVGLIGAGAFALGTMLPILKKLPSVNLKAVATTSGHSARHAGEKFGFERCVTDYRDVLDDPDVQCVVIATRHDQHARMAAEALNQGKDVFVEKPLALSIEELSAVIDAYRGSAAKIMVGFNRRFSPLAVRARELLGSIDEPLALVIRANVGFIPGDSWVHDPEQGGGRILGEVCHFIDLAQFLAGSSPVRVGAESIRGGSRYRPNENVAVTVGFDDGAMASIAYLASGDTSFPRERVEVFGGGAVCVIDNFRSLTFSRGGKRTRVRRLNKDSGHHAEFAAFFSAVLSGGDMPVPFEEYVRSTAATISVEQSLSKGIPVAVPTLL